MPLDLQPVEAPQRPTLDLQPVEKSPASLDLRTMDGQIPSLMDFMSHDSAGSVESSPVTKTEVPESPSQGVISEVPKTESAIIEQQIPEGTKDVRLGEQPATFPRFGKPGTLTRGASDVFGGVLEWAMNKPEEALASLTPLAPAVAARYAPEIAKQFLGDAKAGLEGDREAMGRALTMAAMVGGPAAFKHFQDKAISEGPSKAIVTSPEDMALLGSMPGEPGASIRSRVSGEKQNLEVPVQHETVLPGASETFKEVVGLPATEAPHATSGTVLGVSGNAGREEVLPAIEASRSPSITPSSEAVGIKKPITPSEGLEGTSGTLEKLGNLSDSLSSLEKAFESGDTELRREMSSHVISLLENPEVFNTIVPLIPVDVMDNLGFGKFSSQELLHNQAMFTEHLRANPNLLVGTGFRDVISNSLHELTPQNYASNIKSATTSFRPLLRSDEVGKTPASELPKGVNEGGEGVRVNENQWATRTETTQVKPENPAEETPHIIGPDESPTPTPDAEPVPQLISIKNARVDEQRAQRGEEPLMAPARKSNEVLWDAAMKRIEADPGLPDRLVRELTERPRAITDEEVVILEHRLMELTNELDTARWEGAKAGDAAEAAAERRRVATTPEERAAAAADVAKAEADAAHYQAEGGRISDALTAVEQAGGRQSVEGGPGAGTITARGLAARRMMIRQDYSYGGIERQMREARGFKPLNAQELVEARRISDELKAKNAELQKRLNEQVEIAAKAQAAKELAELKAKEASAQAKVTGRVKAIVLKVGEKLDARADIARARLRGKVLSLSPADLKDIADIAASNLYHIGEDLGKWTAKMIEDVGEKVKPHLDDLWKQARAMVDAAARGELDSEKAAPAEPRKKGAKADKPADPAAVQEAILKRIHTRIAAYEARIAANDFSPWRKPPVEPSKEVLKARYELDQVKNRFYEGLINAKMAQRSVPRRAYDSTVEAVNAMRAVLTSADLSAVLRQGLMIGLAHPLRATKSIGPMIKAFGSAQKAYEVDFQIRNRDNYPLMRASKLYLAEHGAALSKMEEAYLSRLASKIPGIGHIVKESERAYITYLNKLRADSFDAMAGSLGKGGQVTTAQARIISNYINVATGRGTIFMADQAAAGLNAVFFAPRFVASRFQMILGQPLYFGVLSGKAPLIEKGALRARAQIAGEYARILTGAAVVYGLGVAAGAELETDPRSSDFGKLRFGNTRIDMMAGLGQVTVLLSKIGTGEKKSLRTGQILPLVPPPGGKLKFGSEDLDDTLEKFLRFKLAPAPGLAWNYLSGTDAVGNPVTASSLAVNALVPISLSDVYSTMIEQGVPKGPAIGVLSIFGAGVQNFDANRRR